MDENKLSIFYKGKMLHGAAAEQAIIKLNGGWVAHHEKFATKILIKDAINEMNKEHSNPNLKRIK